MDAALIPSTTRFEPTEIASDTFLIHDHAGEGCAPLLVPLNAMVIRGAEPVVVDTGMPQNRERFLADVFSLVEPDDIRWVFVSHEDVDHAGNVNALMAAAPNATVVVNWFMVQRMGASLQVPLSRQRWVGDEERIDVGDRTLVAVRPPIYDSPTTRGLFDPTTGVYWASDAFATPMPTPVRDVGELEAGSWEEGMATFNRYMAPWVTLTDERKFQASVDRVEGLGPSIIAGCHTPVIGRHGIDRAFTVIRNSPNATVAAQPDQSVLELIQVSPVGS